MSCSATACRSTTRSDGGSPRRCAPRCRRGTCPTPSAPSRPSPRNLTGKKLELPVKRILQGADPDSVVSRDSLAEPAVLEPFLAEARERAGAR